VRTNQLAPPTPGDFLGPRSAQNAVPSNAQQ
jgi:hypothetical protein